MKVTISILCIVGIVLLMSFFDCVKLPIIGTIANSNKADSQKQTGTKNCLLDKLCQIADNGEEKTLRSKCRVRC